MTDDTTSDTVVHEPSPTAGEAEVLPFAVERPGRSPPGRAAGSTKPVTGQPLGAPQP